MKLIHTADIHLDSPLSGVTNPNERRHELLVALNEMSEYANNNGVNAIIVAGDLFDENNTSEQTVRSVADIVGRSKASWFVMRGNHGGAAPYVLLHKLAAQINFFGEDWTFYNLGNVTICGRELGRNDAEYWQRLKLDTSRYNILVLHGDVDDPTYGLIDKNVLAACGAKYIALGHRHTFSEQRFGRVRACYSGVLEPRGFDECVQTGFVEIDTETDKIKFLNQSIRTVVTKRINVTGVQSDLALERAISDAVADVSKRNYLNAVLYGELSAGLHLSMVAARVLEGKYFALRVKDETSAQLNIHTIAEEVSLRGEFVKQAMQITDEQLRKDVLKMGLDALNGEVLQ